MTDLITEARELYDGWAAYDIMRHGGGQGAKSDDGEAERKFMLWIADEFPAMCDALESYKSFADQIAKLPDCNDCASNRDCPYLPNWGTTTRINCPLHKPLPAPPEKEGAEHERD